MAAKRKKSAPKQKPSRAARRGASSAERQPPAGAVAAGGSRTRQLFRCEVPADPCAIVIFGASGDLTQRKLLPALFELAEASCLAQRFAILGYAHTAKTPDAFRRMAEEALGDAGTAGSRQQFLRALDYLVNEDDSEADYRRLAERLEKLDRERQLGGNRLFYLAVPPQAHGDIVKNLQRAGLARPAGGQSWVRLVVEKPFGRDRESARALNERLLAVFDEEQIFRIDHYLGKETVQNLLVFRFANSIFEPVWNRAYVDHVQITAAETVGVEQRARFYETAGAVRDMLQSHLLQLVSLVAMEPPSNFDARAVRNEKIKVLEAIRPLRAEEAARETVRGQYGPGELDGRRVPGYREEPGVARDSATETFVAARLWIDNWRWAGVPFYLRTGKRLAARRTEIVVAFRRAPHRVFRGREVTPNRLVLRIQPDEGISLGFGAKRPGAGMELGDVRMDFRYREGFGPGSPGAYTTLLNDAMRGDATLFDRADAVDAAWALVDPILEAWAAAPAPDFPNYAAGTMGPDEAEELLRKDGRRWHNP
jgi:glucose-6-phosphate 1-dehydrogenase